MVSGECFQPRERENSPLWIWPAMVREKSTGIERIGSFPRSATKLLKIMKYFLDRVLETGFNI
jgi:hypothetical protein